MHGQALERSQWREATIPSKWLEHDISKKLLQPIPPIMLIMSNHDSASPLEHFLSWFASLPIDHQGLIAIAAHFIPGFEFEDDHTFDLTRAAALFADRVASYMVEDSRERGAATVLHMCLEYLAFASQGTGDWREQQAGIREAADEFGLPELHDAANSAQFRHAQWVQTREKWNRLKAGPFSLAAIHGFRRLAPRD